MKKILFFFVLLFSVISFAQKDYVNKISEKNEFINLAGKPLTDKFTNIKSVKVVYDYSAKKLYFFNSVKFKYHNDFCVDVLGFNFLKINFNDVSYNATNNRTYLLGNLNFIEKSDDWIVELAASDEMNPQMIQFFFNEIKKNVYFANKLKFYLNTPRLISENEKNPLKIPTVFSDFIFQNLTEQAIQKGSAVGILRKYDLKNNADFHPKENEIIIINKTPEIIPDVKAIIVTEFQTPLSHLVLLAKNRKIPLYVDKQAFENEKYQKFNNKKVEITVTENEYKIAETTKPIVIKKAKAKIVLQKNLTEKNLIDLSKPLPANAQNIIGSKAANLAYLKIVEQNLKTFKTPEYAFAIPFYYFDEHIKNNHLDKEIAELLALPKDSEEVKDKLKQLRKSIKSFNVNPELLKMVNEKLNAQTDFTSFKFRSSTNSEDLEGFNGAGLYDSKSAKLGDSTKTIENAIVDVWASFWNERAFREREIYNIDHRSGAMGILVHRSFPDELANGVLITKNIYREKYAGITVNVQKGENSVVKPEEGITCDEFYAHSFNISGYKMSVDYRSTSNLNDKKPVLSSAEIATLFKISPKIEQQMFSIWKKNKVATKKMPLDIEFKIVGENRTLYIKQARAYID
jgi:pyruvate,water dikinase